jgi:hypothetical protein
VKLRVIREPSQGRATLGSLYVDDVWFSWTLEDEIREQPGVPVEQWKVRGETAIPAGTYQVMLEWSPKFKRMLPELKGVPGYTETKFHAGNKHQDTDGCPLIGFARANATIQQSRAAEGELVRLVDEALRRGEQVTATFENPPSWHAAVA